MGPFPPSFGNVYIHLALYYVSKWVEAISTLKNDAKTVVQFVHKHILTLFGTSICILNDEGSHFCNRMFASLFSKYCVTHAMGLPYHPQSNGQAKISNIKIKGILEKTMSSSRKDLYKRLEWVSRTAFKPLIGMSPFRLIFGKPYHLHVELEHHEMRAIKNLNFNFKEASERRLLQLNELKSCGMIIMKKLESIKKKQRNGMTNTC